MSWKPANNNATIVIETTGTEVLPQLAHLGDSQQSPAVQAPGARLVPYAATLRRLHPSVQFLDESA